MDDRNRMGQTSLCSRDFSGRTPAPCAAACASHQPVREWLYLLQAGASASTYAAWSRITESNPLPATMGRICYADCQTFCALASHSGTVAVRSLELAVGDAAIELGWRFPEPSKPTGKRVTVIGSGPCGLSASYQLAKRGHSVTLIEAQKSLGGMLRFGISEQRLPKRILTAEIGRILDLGVAVHTGAAVKNLDAILAESDGTIWAAGASHCMAVIAERILWKQPIHHGKKGHRTATAAIGRGADAATALNNHLETASSPLRSQDVRLENLPAASTREAGRCILCGSRGTLPRIRKDPFHEAASHRREEA